MDKEFFRQIDQVSELLAESRHELLDDEVLICECFCVNVRDIREVCAEQGIVDLETLKAAYGLGTGCQTCIKKQDTWINRIF